MRYLVAAIVMLLLPYAAAAGKTSIIVDMDNTKLVSGITPGSSGVLVLSLKNTGDITGENVIVALEGTDAVSVSNPSVKVGNLAGLSSVRVPFGIEVSASADPSKTHYLRARVTYLGYDNPDVRSTALTARDYASEWAIPVTLDAEIPKIGASVSTSGAAEAGKTFELRIAVSNAGGDAKNVEVKLGNVSVAAPIGNSRLLIAELAKNANASATFALAVSSDAKPGVYSLPITVDYLDAKDAAQASIQMSTALRVLSTAEMYVAKVEAKPEKVVVGAGALLSIKLENRGVGDAKGVRVALDAPWGRQEAFLGALESKDDASVSFAFVPQSQGDAQYGVTVTYTDDNGEHSLQKRLSLPVYAAAGDNSGALIAAGIAAVAVIVFVLARKR
jgi:hypothetical protein